MGACSVLNSDEFPLIPFTFQATSGLAPDGRMVVSRACEEAANYKQCVT
jgi:20S proteasome alpha/beta subunit